MAQIAVCAVLAVCVFRGNPDGFAAARMAHSACPMRMFSCVGVGSGSSKEQGEHEAEDAVGDLHAPPPEQMAHTLD